MAATADSTRRPRWRREDGRDPRWVSLSRPRRNVVTATVAQDGSPPVPGVWLRCCSPISAPPQLRWLAELATQAIQLYASWRFHPIQSFIDRYVAKFAILPCMATVCFSPDKADHANVRPWSRWRSRPRACWTMGESSSPSVIGTATLFQAQDFNRPLAHLHLPDFAGHCHREFIDDVHVPGDLVVRKLAGTE